jgi:hypothetical protein
VSLLGDKLIAVLTYNTDFSTSQIPVLTEDEAAPWSLTAADNGELASHSFACIDTMIQANGDWFLGALSDSDSTSSQANTLALISGQPGSFKFQTVRKYIQQHKSSYLFVDSQSVALFSKDHSSIPETNGYRSAYYDRIEPGGLVSETILSREYTEENHDIVSFLCGYSFPNGGAYCTVSHSVPGLNETLFGIRVDPRF